MTGATPIATPVASSEPGSEHDLGQLRAGRVDLGPGDRAVRAAPLMRRGSGARWRPCRRTRPSRACGSCPASRPAKASPRSARKPSITASDTKSACAARTSSVGMSSPAREAAGRAISLHAQTAAAGAKRNRKRPSAPRCRCACTSASESAKPCGGRSSRRAASASSTLAHDGGLRWSSACCAAASGASAIAGSSSTIRSTRAGAVRARCVASSPPNECPTTVARSSPCASSVSSRSCTCCSVCHGGSHVERPCPRRSTATTRCPGSASRAIRS